MTQHDPDSNPPLTAGERYPYPAPITVKVPASALTIPISFNSLPLSMVGAFDVRRHLGMPQHPALSEQDANGHLVNWSRLEHADILFLYHGLSKTVPLAAPTNDWHPVQKTLYEESSPAGHMDAKVARDSFTDKIFQNLVDSVSPSKMALNRSHWLFVLRLMLLIAQPAG
jgi:hypothetical protein